MVKVKKKIVRKNTTVWNWKKQNTSSSTVLWIWPNSKPKEKMRASHCLWPSPIRIAYWSLESCKNVENIQCRSLYNNVTWWCIKGNTHRRHQIHVRSRQQTCFSFFMPPKSFNKSFECLLHKTNRLHFSVCVYCNRSQKTSQRVKNNSHATRFRLVSYFFVLYTLWRHLWSITVHTHTEKCNLFVK